MKMWLLKILTYPLILIIRIYQISISPLLGANKCRFTPTCSYYAITSLQKHGLFKGFFLSIKRISKCHPLGKEGYDPVP